MESISLIPAEAYKYIYDIVLGIICWTMCSRLSHDNYQSLRTRYNSGYQLMIWLYFVLVLFVGFRPVSPVFSDMLGYAATYENLYLSEYNEQGLWWVAYACKSIGFSVSMWFATICAIYYGAYFLSSRLLSKNNGNYIFITILVAFGTLTYCTNGVRNGLGLSLLTLGMCIFLTQTGKWKYMSFFLFIYAYLTHRSCILPLICFFVAYYGIGLKRAMYFWVFSVFVSLIAGNQVSNIFLGLGFDDRMDNYLQEDDFSGFSHAGFRWDFLLYSVMPIWLGFYAIIKKGVQNRIYSILLSTYVLSNAFWVMVIRAPFSDRFANLSWFLYPIVIAYPLFNVDIWGKRQGRMARNILMLHFAFTFFMDVVYYTIIKTVIK